MCSLRAKLTVGALFLEVRLAHGIRLLSAKEALRLALETILTWHASCEGRRLLLRLALEVILTKHTS
jgi:hypothetical protein